MRNPSSRCFVKVANHSTALTQNRKPTMPPEQKSGDSLKTKAAKAASLKDGDAAARAAAIQNPLLASVQAKLPRGGGSRLSGRWATAQEPIGEVGEPRLHKVRGALELRIRVKK